MKSKFSIKEQIELLTFHSNLDKSLRYEGKPGLETNLLVHT